MRLAILALIATLLSSPAFAVTQQQLQQQEQLYQLEQTQRLNQLQQRQQAPGPSGNTGRTTQGGYYHYRAPPNQR